jgi:membrane dipeptidase
MRRGSATRFQVATHSNAHALSNSSRTTDEQISAIGRSGGMIGLNYANGFPRADGKWQSEMASTR